MGSKLLKLVFDLNNTYFTLLFTVFFKLANFSVLISAAQTSVFEPCVLSTLLSVSPPTHQY